MINVSGYKLAEIGMFMKQFSNFKTKELILQIEVHDIQRKLKIQD